ncbi:MAG: hypothetical protein IPG24_26905 [Leptospiraceae bacterium]|nr:hypothetical protein [Leptospiraceae bacterium]
MAKYQNTKKIKTTKEISEVLEIVESAFRNVSEETKRDGNTIKANSIDATFGSINRSDTTAISVVKKDDGYLLIADTNYKPSVMFWVFWLLMWLGQLPVEQVFWVLLSNFTFISLTKKELLMKLKEL